MTASPKAKPKTLANAPPKARNKADKKSQAAVKKQAAHVKHDYPKVWKNAFTLGHNVRFTRTPDIEIMRRRAENDPAFAEWFKSYQQIGFKQRMQQTQPNVPLPRQHQAVVAQALAKKHLIATDGSSADYGLIKTSPHAVQFLSYISDSAFFECALGQCTGDVTRQDKAPLQSAKSETASKQAHSADECSVTELYRVLECRFSQTGQAKQA